MIGSILRLKRLARMMSQIELSELSGVNKDMICRIEKGSGPATPSTIYRLERVLGKLE